MVRTRRGKTSGAGPTGTAGGEGGKRGSKTTRAVRSRFPAGPKSKNLPLPPALLSSDEDEEGYAGATTMTPSSQPSSLVEGVGDELAEAMLGDADTSLSDSGDRGTDGASSSSANGGKRKKRQADPMAESLERGGTAYFHAHNKRTRSMVTSDQTMESLNLPGDAEARDIYSQLPVRNLEDKAVLFRYYYSQFPRWRLWLRHGFNMMFFGFGSKKGLLESFVDFLDDGTPDGAGEVVVVNGFSPHLSVKEILNALAKHVAKMPMNSVAFNTDMDRARAIAKIVNAPFPAAFGSRGDFSTKAGSSSGSLARASGVGSTAKSGISAGTSGGDGNGGDGVVSRRQRRVLGNQASTAAGDRRPCRRLYLVIHNLDGPSLRSPKTQEILSFLAEGRGIHIIASIDHLNASFLWDQRLLQRFNWLWNDTTTYLPYDKESEYEEAIVGGAGANAARGAAFVLKSLTPNHRDILRLLAQFQLDEPTKKGLDFHEFYTRCRNEMLVNSDQTLRHHLTEFMDHALVSTTRGADGKEYFFVSLKEDVIRNVILPK